MRLAIFFLFATTILFQVKTTICSTTYKFDKIDISTAIDILMENLPRKKQYLNVAQEYCSAKIASSEARYNCIYCVVCHTYYARPVQYLVHQCLQSHYPFTKNDKRIEQS